MLISSIATIMASGLFTGYVTFLFVRLLARAASRSASDVLGGILTHCLTVAGIACLGTILFDIWYGSIVYALIWAATHGLTLSGLMWWRGNRRCTPRSPKRYLSRRDYDTHRAFPGE